MRRFLFAVIVLFMPMSAMAKPIIVVLGDSISAGLGIEVEEGWVALLQKKLIERKSNYGIINASISGDTTAGGLARVDPILMANGIESISHFTRKYLFQSIHY